MNGQEIGRGQFENAVASERNRMQQQLGDQFSELAANENYMKTMRQQVLNRLIDESLLDQYARELGLSISDEQVKQAIFQTQASRRTVSSTTSVSAYCRPDGDDHRSVRPGAA
ncbi:peptidyl-prolyl cis-trans isomerase D [Klebsiella pneumoniae]|uniref:Peptidyl-prolyl cis-trans isomerase D n=1 Tax=Klebsiella pneumoniae TaxID=573 RepID=A0A2X3FEN0_KLEPN|nr:peptidyl-prolyl cis-trans isomerase D [Klebsiella pneumoniae]